MDRKKTKYNRDDRKYIRDRIENLKNNADRNKIFDILLTDPENICTINSDGAATMNLAVLHDSTLDKLSRYLKKVNDNKISEINVDTDVVLSSCNSHNNDRTYKLSNFEQNILKQKNLKKTMNADNDYEELNFNTKKKKEMTQSKTTITTNKTKKANSNC